jgi:type IV pilus assembly protein PilB
MQKEPYQKQRKFGDIAVAMKFMTRKQLARALAKKRITQKMLGQICIEERFLTQEQLARVMAEQYSYDFVELKEIKQPELLDLIPVDFMAKHGFVPYRKRNNQLTIAMAEPMRLMNLIDELEIMTDMDVSVVVTSPEMLKALIDRIENSRTLLATHQEDFQLPIVKESDRGEYVLSEEKLLSEESPIVKIIDSTILDAITKRASDIHFESSDKGVSIRYRIDGMLYEATNPLDIQHQSALISRIKVMSELDISEKRIPQDGRFKLGVKDRFVDFRISILPTIFGEDAVIRILDRESIAPGGGAFELDGMGLPKNEMTRIRRMITAPYGMFLMTGPTGSGKTTTLYSALSEVNSPDVKIITIEDPVEYELDGIVQIPVNEKKGLTFAKGLRSILRHDPDKILVGEIRDTETAQIALQSALTGHMVFTTVHANRSFEVINRFAHMGVDAHNLITALNCIVAQRLIRTLCSCKKKYHPPGHELFESGITREMMKNAVFFEANGCDRCKGTGYSGRKAIMEMVELNDDLRQMFIAREPMSQIKKAASETGTIFLRKAALTEVFTGVTTLKEANRVTFVEAE